MMPLKPYTVPAHYQNKVVFLDRDGVLNQEVGDYVYDPALFIILPKVPQALARLKAAGYGLVIVTNQGGIDKGLFTKAQMQACHNKLLAATGPVFTHVFYSPHHRSSTLSQLSKPNSLMVERGLHLLQARPEHCWLVGDAGRDLEAAAAVGVQGILVPTLKEHEHPLACHIASSLYTAVDYILAQ